MTIDLRFGDTIEQMKLIPDKSIDAIICDLPYGATACKWDVIIPFDKLWEQYGRIIKQNSAIVLFGSEPFSSVLRMSNIKNYKYDWIWEKNVPTGTMLAKRQPMRKYEIISVFYNNQCTYNRQMIKRTEAEFKDNYRKNDSTQGISDHYISQKIRQSEDRQWYKPPVNILCYKSDKKRDGKGHPTQKPLLLLEYLVKTYSNENDTILDNTFGSCTTGIACINTNRNFIGIENNKEYFNISLNRVEEKRKENDFTLVTSFGEQM